MTSPREIHDMEQIQAACRSMAAMLWAYYSALKDEGFDHESAMELTLNYQISLSSGTTMEEE